MERLTEGHCEVAVITAEEMMELAEQVRRVKEIFADSITVQEIVKSFIDFYVAHGDQNRMEDAILLTNEEALRHRELVERDTARKPDLEGDGYDEDGNIIYDTWICPNCNEPYEIDYDNHDFCPRCGQKIDKIWENGSIRDMESDHQSASFDDDIVSFMLGNGEYGNSFYDFSGSYCEVIGNVSDTPELLKED